MIKDVIEKLHKLNDEQAKALILAFLMVVGKSTLPREPILKWFDEALDELKKVEEKFADKKSSLLDASGKNLIIKGKI